MLTLRQPVSHGHLLAGAPFLFPQIYPQGVKKSENSDPARNPHMVTTKPMPSNGFSAQPRSSGPNDARYDGGGKRTDLSTTSTLRAMTQSSVHESRLWLLRGFWRGYRSRRRLVRLVLGHGTSSCSSWRSETATNHAWHEHLCALASASQQQRRTNLTEKALP